MRMNMVEAREVYQNRSVVSVYPIPQVFFVCMHAFNQKYRYNKFEVNKCQMVKPNLLVKASNQLLTELEIYVSNRSSRYLPTACKNTVYHQQKHCEEDVTLASLSTPQHV